VEFIDKQEETTDNVLISVLGSLCSPGCYHFHKVSISFTKFFTHKENIQKQLPNTFHLTTQSIHKIIYHYLNPISFLIII